MSPETPESYAAQLGSLIPMLHGIPECSEYAELIAEAALALRSDPTSVRTLALLIAAVGQVESKWRLALFQGCGDWTMRTGHWLTKDHIIVVDSPPRGSRWLYPRDSNSQIIPGPYCIPEDQLGWGREAMQIDYFAALTFDWRDVAKNIAKGASILDAGLRAFPGNMEAGIASYNAGPSAVRHALSLGHKPDSVTTGHDYAGRVLEHFKKWGG